MSENINSVYSMVDSHQSRPLVSVIVPAYNHEAYIEEAITSVLNQTYQNIEIIVIDDKSNDATPQIIRSLAEKNPDKIKFIAHEENTHVPRAFNDGIALARGSFIAPHASDDIIPLTGIFDRVEYMLEHPDIDVLVTDFDVKGPDGQVYSGMNKYNVAPQFQRLCDFDPQRVYDQLILGNFLPGGATLIRLGRITREDLIQDPYVPSLSDYDMWMSLAKQFRWAYLDRSTWIYRWHGRNLSQPTIRNIKKALEERIYILAKNIISTCSNKHRDLIIRSTIACCEGLDQLVQSTFNDSIDNSSNYVSWRDHHRWTKSAVARLANQVMPLVRNGAGVHLLMVATSSDFNALANTIDNLAAQGSLAWRLTVFSPDPCPNSLFETLPILDWVHITAAEELPSALDQAVALSAIDWCMVCSPGIRMEPPFLSLALSAAKQHPDWLCIYFDEERINQEGHPIELRLKPDANLELLRSSAYVGQAVLVHRTLWPVLDHRLAVLPRAYAFDAALRAFEAGAEAAVGHIDELAVTLPETADGKVEDWAPIAKGLLEAHLSRCMENAEVHPGLLPGTFFIDYLLVHTPLVSIIIPTKDRFDLLQSCIESLIQKTRYSNYEVIIIDNRSTEPATLEYLTQLQNRDQRFKVITYSQDYNYSAINNYAVRKAQGDFVLLLNNDTVILQGNWLDRLVGIGLRNDVGVVGCRLVYADQRVQHAGVILGLNGIAEHIGIGLPMAEPGYLNRAQLTQNFSAVTAACMLVRKDLFLEVGGLDEKDFAILYNDIDLCLKIGERGYRIVWTPFVTLVHHGNSSLKAEHDANREKHNQHSRKAFIKKWFHRLGNDPAYNRHLSLRQREWMIDGNFDVPWHPDFEPLPRIVAQPPDEMGVGQYRVIGPIKELTQGERICSFMLPALNSDKRFLPTVPELARAKLTVLFLQNAFTEFHLEHLEHYAELLPDVFRIFGQDDIVFSVPHKSAARSHFGKDTKARVRRAVSLCHRVIATTEPIAEALRGMNDDIRIVPNYLECSRWGDLQPPRNERRKPRVGWAGAQQHGGDLEFILPVVEATANEVDWIFMGMCPPKLRYHVAEAHPAVPFDQYPAALAALDLDLAIAPLELNRFNTAKSNLRLLEYGAVGYPVIATDILPYRNAPVTRVPNNPKSWINVIRDHIHELEATRLAGEQLREWVLSNWMLAQHLDEWLGALLPD